MRVSGTRVAVGEDLESAKSPENILKLLAGDHCVSVSITESRLIARGHQSPFNSISCRIHSTEELRGRFSFFHPRSIARVTRSSIVVSIRTGRVLPSRIGVPLSIPEVNEINHPARGYRTALSVFVAAIFSWLRDY